MPRSIPATRRTAADRADAASAPVPGELPLAEYRALAELRYQVRRFLRFSEEAARAARLEPQQHQLLLAIKGLPETQRPTIKALAERLCVKHQTTVALVDHLEARGLLVRERGAQDRREVLLRLTGPGESVLRRLSVLHREQFRTIAPVLVRALGEILPNTGE